MRTPTARAAAVVAALGLAATGCAGGGGTSAGGGRGTVTIAVSADPGSLDPLNALSSTAIFMNGFGYARLVQLGADGTLVGGVAERWTAGLTSATFTIRQGVTCQDGSPLTAEDVAAEYNHIGDPRNASPMLGLSVPFTAKATADPAARTVTVKTARPSPFILQMANLLPLVCRKNLADTKALSRTTAASGPYRLTEAVPSDHYTYVKRPDVTWTPGGADMSAAPDKVVFKVVTNESTAANLLMSGQVNLVQLNGSDRQRLEAARVAHQGIRTVIGQWLFNEAPGHATGDPAVRRALVTALDLAQVGSVASGGRNVAPTNLGETAPTPCPQDSVTGNVPGHDPARAAADLTAAGWARSGGQWTKDGKPLQLTVTYPTTLGPRVTAAVELAAQQWTAFGVKVATKTVTPATVTTVMGSDGWDVAWQPIVVNLPDQLVRFYDGPRLPKGSNFGGIDNPDYRRLSGQAMAKLGTAGCPLWTQAESALVKRLDVVPFATSEETYYGKGVTFRLDGAGPLPHTLRRTAG
ncbi:ABC transporter substrate-binding protein [Actinomadura logoneensis]|uniref:ABC transporter substrate-binding protein n=1 Tax=Actinomadura logoneensis TaxID=2293572 RepID=A0A372JBK5_9ACTN|nr:ABC transporter substrate-binding protein [Actinomadura logoneensis]RFU37391.1 ABC transporter substrate-binding protein [Actinomadura logoneensis]